jgi:hypothetical protein
MWKSTYRLVTERKRHMLHVVGDCSFLAAGTLAAQEQ